MYSFVPIVLLLECFICEKDKTMKNIITILLNVILVQAIAQTPTITNLSPTSGPIGTTVTITGTNFSTTVSNNTIWFGGVKATVTSATATSLVVIVPAGATHDPIRVLVNGKIAQSPKVFIITFSNGFISSTSLNSKVDFATGTVPYGSSLGDLDGDGKLDLVVTNSTSNTVSVYKNTSVNGNISSGSFASKVDFTTVIYISGSFVGTSPQGVSLGDIDGDGKLDLVVATISGGGLVFRNTSTSGSILFDGALSFSFSHKTWCVSIGDIDGDGKLDLVSTGFNTISDNNRVSVLKNKSTSGNISFEPVVIFFIGPSKGPRGVSTGDLDGDGKLDIVVANLNSANVSVLQNYSQDTIFSGIPSSINSKVDFGIGTQPWGLSIGDIDGDGKLDLVVANSGTNTVSVLRNISTVGTLSINSFAAKVDFVTGSAPYNVSIGDIDGDGKLDLAVANSGSNNVSILKNTSINGIITSGSFASKVDFVCGASPYNVSIGDIDGDGKADLAVTNGISNTVSIFKNIGIPSPNITTFAPLSGGNGTLVTITGTNFTGATNVKFGGINASSFTVLSATSISALVAYGTTGIITVTTPNGAATSIGTFTYIPSPTITSFTPTSASSGANVIITGTNFTGATNVKFGGINATSFTVLSASSITAVVGSGATGIITVTTPGGNVTSTSIFTFISITAPALSTNAITNITSSAATSGGNISSDGGGAITSKGVCWSTSSNPTTSNSKTNDGTGAGVYTSNITTVNPNTLYYVRAYATNSVGTAYGNQVSFTSGSTSIAPQKIKEDNYISLFPNPSNGKMFLKSDFNKNDLIEINAMNILGDCYKIKYNFVENGLLELNIPDYITGIITLEITINGKSTFEKVTIMK